MSIHLPVVCVEADVLLRDGEAAGGTAPVRADADPAAEVRHAPPGLVIQNLHPEVSRLARALKIRPSMVIFADKNPNFSTNIAKTVVDSSNEDIYRDAVAEALCAPLGVGVEESEEALLAAVALGPGHVALAPAVSTALPAHRPRQRAGAGLAVRVVPGTSIN